MDNLCYKCLSIQGYQIGWYQSIDVDSKRKSLLFVHGIASQASHWIELIKNFENMYNIYLLDRPGYGKSDMVKGYSNESYYILIEEIIKKMNIKTPLIYIGHSLGAYLGLKLALRNISFDKIILLAPFINYSVDQNLILYKELCKKRVEELSRNGFCKYDDENIIKKYCDDVKKMNNEAIWNDFCMISNDKIEINMLYKIESRIFIIHGFEDKIVSYRKGQTISKVIKRSKLFLLNNCGHNFFIGNARTVSRIMEKYIIE